MRRLRLIALFLLAIGVHIESLGYWFVAVDSPKLILSSRVTTWGDAVEIFTQPLMHETEFTTLALFYRPLASLSYTIDYWVWGVDPFGYHLTNLLLQGVAVVTVAVVVGELSDDAVVGQLTAVLFALHPLTAEVVPAAPRRHDVLMLIFLLGSLALFVRSQRDGVLRRDSALYLGGSLVVYVLALGSKEPALVVPALVFVWAVFQQFDGDPYGTLWRSVWATVPYGVLTVAYLAVRIAVLGELGGYRGSSVVFEDVGGIVAAYFVSVVYPVDVLGNGLAAGGLWIGVVFLVGALLVLVAVSAVGSAAGRIGAMDLPLVALLVGCALLVMRIPWAGWEPFDPIGELLPPLTPSPYPPPHTITGVLLGTTCLIGGLWALWARPSTSDRIDIPSLAVFIVWFVVPLALYIRGHRYLVRTGYVSIVPLMAIFSLVLVSAVRERRTSDRTLDHNAVLVGGVLLLLVPQIAASPLFHSYDGWQESGEVNRMVFNGLADELPDQDGPTTLRVRGLPSGIAESGNSFPKVRSIVYPGAQATGSWLRLTHPERELTVHNDGRTHLHRVPERVSINTTRNTDTLIAELHYEHNDTDREVR